MTNKRIWEIDFLRTVAVILMILFHIIYDLNEFMDLNISYLSGFWYWEGKISALLFIFLAGISSGFSKNNIKRGIALLVVAVGISIITYIVFDQRYVRFGILHLLGTSMLLFPLLNKINKWILLFISAPLALAAFLVDQLSVKTSMLLPFGIEYTGFRSVDYYPLVPYIAVFILGVFIYKIYYYRKKSIFKFNIESRIITTISRNSLLIYIIHQPIIIGLLYLLEIL